MNFDRLRFVAERAEVGEAREALIAVTIPERPGAFREVLFGARPPRGHRVQLPPERPRPGAHLRRHCHAVAPGRRRAGRTAPRRPATRPWISPTTRWRSCTSATWSVARAPDVRHERLCRFEFPERPGALTQFLEKLGGRWNISLFHYRNHGADFGRVLAGFEVAEDGPCRVPCVPRRARVSLHDRVPTTPRTSSFSRNR